MADDGKQPALRKRQQIENAGRNMFLWVAIAAALVGTAGVVGVSLFQRMVFNQRVISEKNNTVSVLKNNNEIVEDLKNNVRVLNTNAQLRQTPRSDGAEPLTVVLDALPAQANADALGTSLQEKLFNVGGITIENLSPTSTAAQTSTADDAENSVGTIGYQFTVTTSSSNINALKQVLRNFERSIRAINVISLEIEQQNNRVSMSGELEAYYLPEATVELKDEEVSP